MSDLAEPRDERPVNPEEFHGFVIAYFILLGARYEAQDLGIDPRDNPRSLPHLHRLGVGYEELLWMLFQAHVEHIGPVLEAGEGSNPGVLGSAVFGEQSGFALTPLGEAFADRFLARVIAGMPSSRCEEAEELLQLGRLAPHYDEEKRLLIWGAHPLKGFEQPAKNQELVLLSAEELAWPDWFDDPLPPGGVRNPKIRLHDTIKNLNRHQKPHLVQFKGDGTGTQCGWELK